MLLLNLNLLATAPDGVARLRELILTLAVQGKLVPQDPSDEPASVLLKKIRAEKDRLIAEGTIKRNKPVAGITEDGDDPFELPQGWEWCKGRDLFTVIRGVTYQKHDARDAPADNYLPILRANNIRGSVNLDELVYVPSALVSDDQRLKLGDYVVCLASGSKHLVGKAAPFHESLDCSFGAFCGAIRPVLEMAYFAVYLASPLYRDAVSEASAGIGINNLKGSSLLNLDVALPPLAEQSRIGTRVEELMRLCDALQAKACLEATQHAQLVATLLSALTTSTTPEKLTENWHRVATHFDLLLDRPEAVDALEQTILQLAVRGLLVPQDPRDEPASQLLNRLLVGSLVGAPPTQSDIEAPFPIPGNWSWVTLARLSKSMSNGLYKSAKFYSEAGTACVRMYNIQDGALDLGKIMRLEVTASELEQYALEPGDLLINRVNSRELVGKCAVVAAHHEPLVYEAMNIRIRLVDMVNMPSYVNLVLRTKRIRELFQGDAKQAVGQASINQTQVGNVAIPLPPLAEQSRIVARVASLRALCFELRQRFTTARTQQTLFAEVLVKEVV